MRILFVNPPMAHVARYAKAGYDVDPGDTGRFPPLGLLYLIGNLSHPAEHEVKLLDAPGRGLTHADLEREIAGFQPDLVGITACTLALFDCLLVARVVRRLRPGAHICFGGPQVNDFPGETLARPEVDSVIRGEGEPAFAELADRLAAGRDLDGIVGLSTRERPRTSEFRAVADLDALRFPAREHQAGGRYRNALGLHRAGFTSMITSRGCPMQCTFCTALRKQFKPRSVANVLEEVRSCQAAGYREIMFQDDSFNLDQARVKEFCRALAREPFRVDWSFKGRAGSFDEELLELAAAAGCFMIHIGVETGTPAGLDALRKGITIAQLERTFALTRKHRIRTIADFMIGLPFERTVADIDRHVEFLFRLRPTYVQFNVLQPFPRTELFRQGEAKGLLSERRWLEWMRQPDPDPEFEKDIWPEYFTREELSVLMRRYFRRFYFRPATVWDHLTDIRSRDDLRNKLGGLTGLLKMESRSAR